MSDKLGDKSANPPAIPYILNADDAKSVGEYIAAHLNHDDACSAVAAALLAFANGDGPIVPENYEPKVWVATIDHKNGTNQYADTTEDGILAQLSEYCNTMWPSNGPPHLFPNGMTDREIVEVYFEHQSSGGEEWMVREEVTLGGQVAP